MENVRKEGVRGLRNSPRMNSPLGEVSRGLPEERRCDLETCNSFPDVFGSRFPLIRMRGFAGKCPGPFFSRRFTGEEEGMPATLNRSEFSVGEKKNKFNEGARGVRASVMLIHMLQRTDGCECDTAEKWKDHSEMEQAPCNEWCV